MVHGFNLTNAINSQPDHMGKHSEGNHCGCPKLSCKTTIPYLHGHSPLSKKKYWSSIKSIGLASKY